MKKIFTLLWLALIAFTFKTTAQPGTTCNPEFAIQYINSNTVKFSPVVTEGAPLVQHTWHFGDGTPVSNLVIPTHIYALPGTYPVVHTIVRFNPNNVPVCTQSFTKIVQIGTTCNLVANFSWSSTAPNPLVVAFQNLSVPLAATDSVTWQFGDSTISHALNPVHTYASAGTYQVCLTVKKIPGATNAPCVRTICKTVVITDPCVLVANFTSQPDPIIPLRFKFTNTSTPIHPSDSVRWTFGDGTSLSGLQSDAAVANPSHNYIIAGNYTVCLRVKKNSNISTPPTAICVREKCNTLVVTQPCNFPVNFSWHPDALNARKIYFTNLSTPSTVTATAVWTFGDGTGATSWNAVHEYAQPGSYRVCVKIYLAPNSNCVREFCDTVYIAPPAPSCNQLSKYRYERFTNDIQKYKFTPDHINPAYQYTWTFGDGTGSSDPIAIHRYAQPGIYIACLTVWNGPNCASTTCKEITVQHQITCDTSHVSYTFQRNPQVPNKISFFASGTLPILDQTWTITRAGTTTPPVILHQNNPVYTFPDTGNYKVCLRAVMLGGCVKEYCNYIRIEQVSHACTLLAFPNPASAAVNVNVLLAQPQMIHAYVYNSQNVLVLDKHHQGFTGNNLITMQVNNLPAGQYTIRLIYGNSVCYASFQKL